MSRPAASAGTSRTAWRTATPTVFMFRAAHSASMFATVPPQVMCPQDTSWSGLAASGAG